MKNLALSILTLALTMISFPANTQCLAQSRHNSNVNNIPYPVYRQGHNMPGGGGYYSRGSSNYGGGVFVNGTRYYETYVLSYNYSRYYYPNGRSWRGNGNLMISPGFVPGYGNFENFNQRY